MNKQATVTENKTQSNTPETPIPETPKQKQKLKAGFFSGILSNHAKAVYNILIAIPAFKTTYGSGAAHKVASDFVSDFARYQKEDNRQDMKDMSFGKLKDGAVDAKIKLMAKGIKTDAGIFVSVCKSIDQMKMDGLITDRFLPPFEVLNSSLREYLENSKKWADGVEWTE